MAAKGELVNLIALQTSGRKVPPELLTGKQTAIDEVRTKTRSLQQSRKELGSVFGSGGSDRVSSFRSPMDWAVVEPPPGDIVWKSLKELNRVRFYISCRSYN